MKNPMGKVLSFFAALALFVSCAGGHTGNETATKMPLQVDSSEGMADIKFSITEMKKGPSGSYYKVLSGLHGKDVGFAVSIPAGHKGGETEELTIMSLGQPSNELLNLLSKLYHVPASSHLVFKDSVAAACTDLNVLASQLSGKSAEPSSASKKYKLFFEADTTAYAEIFLNIDEAAHTVELAEKDQEYRPFVIANLRKQRKL